jgi:ABC-type branched-subunit amino acid transport system ATPase component
VTQVPRGETGSANRLSGEAGNLAVAQPTGPTAHSDGPASISCRNLDVFYGQAQVIFGVDLEVSPGEMVALLGVNGAGKSTLLRAICGLVPVARGEIAIDGRPMTNLPTEEIAAQGVAMVPGGRGVFPTLSVSENLRVACWTFRKDRAASRDALQRALSLFPVLAERRDQAAGNLSGGEQQMLALAQAFMAGPRVLMIDELSLGLAPVIVGQLLEVVRSIHRQGVTVILVEQSLNVALNLCPRAVFMEKGEVRFDGPSSELRSRPDLLRAVFLGKRADKTDSDKLGAPEEPPAVVPPVGAGGAGVPADQEEPLGASSSVRHGGPARVPSIAIDVRDVTVRFGGIRALSEVSMSAHQGEILALIGGNGAGKTTLFDVISGFLRPDSGKVLVHGKNLLRWSAPKRSRHGLGRSFQDSLLFSSLTVRETIAVGIDRHVPVHELVSLGLGLPEARRSEAATRGRVEELIALMGLSGYADAFLSELSTGTRRMVDIACALGHRPDVLLLDEPAAGIAQKETEQLAPLIRRIRDETGACLLVIEHDMPLIREVADRAVVLEAGTVIAEGSPAEVQADPRVMASYLGSDLTAVERSGGNM